MDRTRVADLLLRERDSRTQDLRFYRGLGLSVRAAAGTVFFGLMLMFARLLDVGTQNPPMPVREAVDTLAVFLPILGISAQFIVDAYMLLINGRIRNTIFRLEMIHREFGVDPNINTPWLNWIFERRKRLGDNRYFFLSYTLGNIPAVVVYVIWFYLLYKAS